MRSSGRPRLSSRPSSTGCRSARSVYRRQLHGERIAVAHCTVARLMRDLGLQGVCRGRGIRITIRGDGHDRADDLLQRDFTASHPNERWVADFTYVATWSGIVYVAFVVDVFSRAIVCWSAATIKRAKLVPDTLDMSLWRRDRAGNPAGHGLIHHSDAGSQYTSFAFTATSSRPVSMLRSAPSATPWTTPSWSPNSACRRPS